MSKVIERAIEAPALNKQHYMTWSFSQAAFFPKEETDIFNKALYSKDNICQKMISAAQQILKLERERTVPYTISIDDPKVITMDESAGADMLHIEYDKFDDSVVVLEHHLYNLLKFNCEIHFTSDQAKQYFFLVGQIKKQVGKNLQKLGIQSGQLVWKYLCSTPSYLKVGKSLLIRVDIQAKYKKELALLRTKEQFDRGTNPVEYNKVLSTLFSGSVPVSRFGLKKIALKNAIIVKDFNWQLKYTNVLKIDAKTGAIKYVPESEEDATIADGQSVIIARSLEDTKNFLSLQGRLGTNKTMAVVAIVENIPDKIKDYQGIWRSTDGIYIILSESCCKGLKWFDSLDDYRTTFETLGIDELRVCGFANKAEGDKRNLSRQALQELVYTSNAELRKLGTSKAICVKQLKTVEGCVKELQKPWADEEECGNAAKFFRAFPDYVANQDIINHLEDLFNNKYADAMISPAIEESHYEYIAMDPYALIDVWVFGKDPAKEKIGVFNSSKTCCVTGVENGRKIYGIRHPANLLNARVLHVEVHDELAVCGNMMILPWNSTVLSGYWDGDNDGDEGFWSSNPLLVSLMERVINRVNPPCVIFDHDKAPKGKLPKTDEWQNQTAQMMIDAERYNEVGVYSNLCTKILNDCRIDMDPSVISGILETAAIPHVLTILILDYIKTGVLPQALREIARTVGQNYNAMPYNQRFAKHCDETPWNDQRWDEKTLPESESIVDRFGHQVNLIIGGSEWAPDFSKIDYRWEIAMPGGCSANVRMVRNDVLPAEKVKEYNDMLGKEVFAADTKYSIYFLFETLSSAVQKIAKASFEAAEYEEAMLSAYKYVRDETLAFMQGVNKGNMSDDELARWTAAAILRQHVAHAHDKWNKKFAARHLMAILECFGDILAENKQERTILPAVIPEKTFRQECVEAHEEKARKAALPSWLAGMDF